jgi:hypothetical protein
VRAFETFPSVAVEHAHNEATPAVAQLAERSTVDSADIEWSLVRFRAAGFLFVFLLRFAFLSALRTPCDPIDNSTVWPSGLRRQTQVLVEQSAWVRTPQLSVLPPCYNNFRPRDKTPPAGLEPAIFGLEVRRVIHYAKRALGHRPQNCTRVHRASRLSSRHAR